MKIWSDDNTFKDKTPAMSDKTREWMLDFICELGELIHDELCDSVSWDANLHVIPGVEVSGFIPYINGGLRLVMWAPLEAEADPSHYPSFPCVRQMLDKLTQNMEQDYQRTYGASLNDAEIEQYHEFVDAWNDSCDAYVDYVLEVWQYMDKVQMQAHISLDDDRTAMRRTWYVGELPDPVKTAEELKPVILTVWERRI